MCGYIRAIKSSLELWLDQALFSSLLQPLIPTTTPSKILIWDQGPLLRLLLAGPWACSWS